MRGSFLFFERVAQHDARMTSLEQERVEQQRWTACQKRPVPFLDALVEGELIAHGKVCATCRGTFVAVKPGHPAYHRW